MLLIIEALLLTLAALGQDYTAAVKRQLDMAPNSVDDQYEGCTEEMAKLVETKSLKNTDDLEEAWNTYAMQVKQPSNILKISHLIAIRVYTCNDVYTKFNKDVYSDKSKYKNRAFEWYSLHFWLTEAIQILKRQQNQCHSIYRGTIDEYQGEKGIEFRFGKFASFSRQRSVAQRFGKKSCFQIENYKGAELTNYSEFCGEQEVLIPPYETFKVIDVKTKSHENDLWCDTVFMLESTGTRSDLNCALFESSAKKIFKSLLCGCCD